MATRERRLSEFNSGPPPDHAVELLCEDHNGTYVLPYLCEWKDSAWHNCMSRKPIDAKVVGWR
jgi:hypothetical protein